jgi:hypothetical protein
MPHRLLAWRYSFTAGVGMASQRMSEGSLTLNSGDVGAERVFRLSGDATNDRGQRASKAMSAAEFKQQLAALGFVYVWQTRGFLDLHREKHTRFKRLLGVRDEHGRLKRSETLGALLAARSGASR